MNKVCVISNECFTYLLKVDGMKIAFQGIIALDYFERHYKELGYEVIMEDNYK